MLMNLKFALTILLQSNYEEWGLKSILIAAIIALGTVVGYLYKSKEKALTEQGTRYQAIIADKDKKIMEVIKDHKDDLKATNTDYAALLDKYNDFTHRIKDIANAGRS